MPEFIKEFQGEFRFLSNFFPSPIKVRGLGLEPFGSFIAPTAEHVFQALKTRDLVEQEMVLDCLTPGEAKRAGRRVTLREDWDDIKLHVMSMVVEAKFEQNPDLAAKLIATGDAKLIEGNTWNDMFWGASKFTGTGHNHLGRILMETRDKLKD